MATVPTLRTDYTDNIMGGSVSHLAVAVLGSTCVAEFTVMNGSLADLCH